MKKIFYILLILMVFNLQSCDDYVDIEPRGSAIATTLEDVDALLNNGTTNVQTRNTLPNLIHGDIKIAPEILSQTSGSNNTNFINRIYGLEPLFYIGNQTDITWSNYYTTIGFFNNILTVLDNIDATNETDQERNQRLQYAAEAKVHRAFSYFRLVNIYGVHFGLPEASNEESGVPLLTVFGDDAVSLKRYSVNEVYDFVLKDLNDALPNLPNTARTRDRASLGAALGLLGEIELHRGNYDIALEHLNNALDINGTLLDYNIDAITVGVENPESLLVKTYSQTSNNSRAVVTYSDELLFITDEFNDLRFTQFVVEDEFGDFGISDQFFEFDLGVTVPKLMVFKAECLARTGSFMDAMNVINALRATRFNEDFVFFDDHVLTATDQEDAIAKILEESRREFRLSGQRFFEIKRLNAIENAGISLSRDGATYAPNSINWALPISANVINTSNGQIVQNERE